METPARRWHSGSNLAEGSVRGHISSLAGFVALGVVATMSTTLADTFFIGQLGTRPLAALGFSFPVQITVGALGMGLGTGVVAVVARAVGEGDRHVVRALGTDSILLAVLISLTLAVVGYLSIEPLFAILGALPDVMPLVRQYMQVWWFGALGMNVSQVCSMILRAHGDTKSPSAMQTTMAILNITLDPILIFGLGPIAPMGLRGAAVAMILARAVAVAGMFAMLHFRAHALAPPSFAAERLRASWSRLLRIALPSMTTQLVVPISSGIVTKVVALSGTVAVAAYGAASRIESLSSIYTMALGAAMAAFVGQNAGAGLMDRVWKAVTFATRLSVLAGGAFALALVVLCPLVVRQLSDSPEVRRLAVEYLRVVAVSYLLAGMVLISAQTLNALSRPIPAAMISLARSVGLIAPLVVIGNWLDGIHGVFVGISIGGLTAGALGWGTLRWVLDRKLGLSRQPTSRATA